MFEEAVGGIAGVRLWAKQHGVPSHSLMEADLVVTNRALCYVTQGYSSDRTYAGQMNSPDTGNAGRGVDGHLAAASALPTD
jgi:hypothetical protein